MKLSFNLDSETERTFHDVFPEGIQEAQIMSADFKQSKAGNDMLVLCLVHLPTGLMNSFFLTLIEKKRWLLKNLLETLDCYKKTKEGYYAFDTDDLVNKNVTVLIKNYETSFVDAALVPRTEKKSHILKFIKKINIDDIKVPF
jgi:hypothetical protein